MKTFTLILSVLVGLAWAGLAAEEAPAPKPKGRLLHVVAFKFKETATPAQIKEVEDAFRALRQKIKEVKSLEWGTNVSPEKHDKGFTHTWILTFESEQDRDAYLVHPDHDAFVKIVGPVVADVFVVDFWAKR